LSGCKIIKTSLAIVVSLTLFGLIASGHMFQGSGLLSGESDDLTFGLIGLCWLAWFVICIVVATGKYMKKDK